MATAPIGALRADLMANSAMFAADMKAARDAVSTASAAMQRTFSNLQKGANRAVSEIFNLRNAAAVLAVGALVAFVKANVKAAAEIDDTSQRLGISATKFQELSFAAKLAGIEQEDFTKAFEQFNKRIGDFSGNITGSQKALGQLGLTMADLKGKTPDEQFALVADGFKKIEDPALRATLAADLFGKSGIKLLNVLTDGSAGLKKYAEEAHKLGFILSDETIKKAAQADDEFDRIGKSLKIAGINIAAGFLPGLTEIRKIFTSQDFQDGVRKTSAALADFVKWMVDNKDTIIIVSTTLAGLKLGAAFGSGFGKQGAVIGAVTGALTGYVAGVEMANDSTKQLQETLSEPLKVTVTGAANPISPEVGQAIDDLVFKTRILKGDFDLLAEGFPEAAKGLKQFGMDANESRTSVELLSPQMQLFNQRMLEFKAAQLTQENLLPWEKYEQQLMRIDQLVAKTGMSEETAGRMRAKAWSDASQMAQQYATEVGSALTTIFKDNKAASIAAAIINTAVAITKALSSYPPPWSFAMAGLQAAAGAVQIASIKSQKFDTGGSFRVGGVGPPDSKLISMQLTPGEMVDIRRPDQVGGTGAAAAGGGGNRTFTIDINPRSFFGQHMRVFAEEMIQAQRDGYSFQLNPA
jgi:hypothetical protein